MSDKLKDTDICSIVYFWQEKRSPERMVDWDALLPLVTAEYPEFVEAWEQRKKATKRLDEIVEKMSQRVQP